MNAFILFVLTVLAGFTLPIQAGINASLAKHLQSAVQAAWISFCGGLCLMTVAALLMGHYLPAPKHIAHTPPYLLIGGLFGGIMVITAILVAPRIGAVALVGCLVTGQLICSMILDHYGWLGFKEHPINVMRVLGVCFLLCGIYFIKRF